jgi:hypothetical protein
MGREALLPDPDYVESEAAGRRWNHDRQQTQETLERIIREFPNSEAAPRAKVILENLQARSPETKERYR